MMVATDWTTDRREIGLENTCNDENFNIWIIKQFGEFHLLKDLNLCIVYHIVFVNASHLIVMRLIIKIKNF